MKTIMIFSGITIFLFLLAFIFVRFIVILVTVESNSMLPVLRPGDRAIVLRYWPLKWLKKGDIVLAWPPFGKAEMRLSRKGNELLPAVKRIIGLPQEIAVLSDKNLIEISNSEKNVSINLNYKVQNIPDGFFFCVEIIIQKALTQEIGGRFHMRIS